MHLKTDTTSGNAHYARVPQISHSRNSFSISEKHLMTMNYDYLYPCWHKYIYPGDTLSITQHIMARLTTQVAVLYDDLYFDVHAWFTPNRLTHENWARFQFNTQPLGPTQDNTALTTPAYDLANLGAGFESKSIFDYFGFPTLIDMQDTNAHINTYLTRSYNIIWNENYRDQNIQDSIVTNTDNGPDDPANYSLLPRGKRHDVFTSALPFQQKGTSPGIPLSGVAPVSRIDNAGYWEVYEAGTDNPTPAAALQSDATGKLNDGTITLSLDPRDNIVANLNSSLASILVNDLRTTLAVQHLLEGDARGGTRDIESIQHRWGVTVPDFRLAKPEYCGGATFTFDGHVVPQSSETGTTPQGTLTQFSQSLSSFNMTHSFVEHGVFMILISARSNITYQQGLQKELSYRTRFDFFQPEFANLGEVAVKNQELLFSDSEISNNDTFGYQEYGYELRYGLNRVSGEFRSNYPQSRDNKHMALDFGIDVPVLDPDFIQSFTPISRNIAVAADTADPIELSTLVTGSIARTLPMYSIPGLTRL